MNVSKVDPAVTTGTKLVYNETSHKVEDLGGGGGRIDQPGSSRDHQVTNQRPALVYNEQSREVEDVGAGPFERFDSSPEARRRENEKKVKQKLLEKKKKEELLNASRKENRSGTSSAQSTRKIQSRKSSEGGFHSGILIWGQVFNNSVTFLCRLLTG